MKGEGTEETVDALKAFLTGRFNEILQAYADDDTPLNLITEDCIAMGGADLSRYEIKKITVVIIPESEDRNEGHIGDTAETVNVIVSFLCRGYAHGVLIRQMCRYTAALRKAIDADSSLGDRVADCGAGKTDFFPNTGSVDGQMTAAETEITVTVEQNRGESSGGFNDFDEIF